MRRAATALLLLASVLLPAAASGEDRAGHSSARGESRTIEFRGETARVPASWPVFRLAERPRMCVRMDRKAVYLGTPGPNQRCPSHALGRRRAILLDPAAGNAKTDGHRGPRGAHASAGGVGRSAGGAGDATGRAAGARVSADSGFTGLGFDACAAPSRRAMRAWEASPYRAIGVYIGGLNRACSQPNLTASWVSEQIDNGWHLIPTYVGLQAPTSSCSSCATLSSSSASSQGSAAAVDAVADAAAIGLGPGSPIYYDMESYTRTSSSTNATLNFLAAWTRRLHALGYVSGVYSSSASGISDLVSRLGSDYPQPDSIWIANWNGSKTTSDPYVPASAWDDHQRIHQYRGGHNETWGGVTINIDNNYVEGATAGSAAAVATPDDPKGRLDFAGSPAPGQVRVAGWAFDPNARRKAVSIRVYVGGEEGRSGAVRHELGPAAVQPRADIAEIHRAAGADHGFDVSFATTKSGRQPVCVYALNLRSGSDTLLGCRNVGVGVPISLLRLKAHRNAVRVRVRCEWPAGAQCPGRILLRAKVRVPAKGRARRSRARRRTARRRIAGRGFRLTGGRSHTFRAGLSQRGRLLIRDHGRLRAQLVVAIPGGRVTRPVMLTR